MRDSEPLPERIRGIAQLAMTGTLAFLTVVDLFAAQAILPALTQTYAVSPATMSAAVNASTLGMAAGGLGVALFGGRIDRRRGMLLSLGLLTIPTLLLASLPTLPLFALLRIVQGLCMSTAFALGLAYLGERSAGRDSAAAFAAYVTGNVASNLLGRMMSAGAADHFGLSANFQIFAALNLLGALLVHITVRPAPRATRGPAPIRTIWSRMAGDPRLTTGFAIGFCILFAFIGTFTFVNFVLARPPLSLGMMGIGFVYLVFLPSILTTPLAGAAVRRFGPRSALWSGLTLALIGLPLLLLAHLGAVLTGMVLIAAGTFFAQAVATGYVGRIAESDREAASGFYLASYFCGGLVGSVVLGQVFDRIGWAACVAGIGGALLIAWGLTFRLRGAAPRAVILTPT